MRRTLRTFFLVPGHLDEAVSDALSGASGADVVVVDLEDSVPADQHTRAVRNLATVGTAAPNMPVLVRLRGGRSERAADLAAVPSGATGVVLARAEDPEDVARVRRTITNEATGLGLWLLVETARGLEALPDLLRAGAPIEGVMLGAGDLRLDGGLGTTPEEIELAYPRSRLVFASRAAGITQIVDTPLPRDAVESDWPGIADRARTLGLTGKFALSAAEAAAITAS